VAFRPARFAALAYPLSPDSPAPDESTAERLNPWTNDEQTFLFKRLPTNVEGCRSALTDMLAREDVELRRAS
jgi:hypothetical protein